MRAAVTALACSLAASCASAPPPAPAPVEPPPAIVKGAAGDHDLRVMIAQIAAARACDLVEHQFRTLRADTPGEPVVGVVWLRDCQITHDGTKLAIEVGGRGWQWVDRESTKAGASFHLRQYVKFALRAKLGGAVDVGYDPRTHVATLWLSPMDRPDVEMTTLGGVEIDRDGVWSDVVGFVGSAVGRDPDRQGEQQVHDEGKRSSIEQLGKGLTITMNLCNGLSHVMLGHLPRGIYGPAGAGETRRAPIEIHPAGLLVFSPQAAPDGLTIRVDSQGPVRIGLACRDQGEAAAAAFLDGTPVAPRLLAEKVVTGKATLEIGPQRCPVSVIAQSVVPVPVTFDFDRPLTEAAHATQGALVRCNGAP